MASSYITCSHCGKTEDLETFRQIQSPLVAKMRGEQLCFGCAYWRKWMERPEPDTIIASRNLFRVTEPLKVVNRREAKAKNLRFLLVPHTSQVYAGANLILRGTIPTAFQDELPDQYKLITRDEYLRIYDYGCDMCRSKGCFDRYHCIWYHPEIMELNGPWNTIPENYEVGTELCPSFVNKHKIYGNI